LQCRSEPWHPGDYSTIKAAFRYGINENFWRHGLTISQVNEFNVAEQTVKDRLNYIRSHLLREMYGNNWRRKGCIHFLVFKHGSKGSFNEHYHALMGIDTCHNWSDARIAETIMSVDASNNKSQPWRKTIHVDHEWNKNNQFHSYVSRFVQEGLGDYFII